MEKIDKRWIIGGIAAIVIVVTIAIVMSEKNNKNNNTPVPPTPSPSSKSKKYHGTVGGVANKHAIYGTQLRGYPNPCGADGDVSNCPKYVHPTLVGEDRAIYAIHNGTIHDPRLKSRMCSYTPQLLCVDDDTPETEYPWAPLKMDTAIQGLGNELQVAYGYNIRKALIEGGSSGCI